LIGDRIHIARAVFDDIVIDERRSDESEVGPGLAEPFLENRSLQQPRRLDDGLS
jgi:hypothetical protein